MLNSQIISGREIYDFDLHNSGQIKIAEELIVCRINSRKLYIPEKIYFDFLIKFNDIAKKRNCETKIEDLAGE